MLLASFAHIGETRVYAKFRISGGATFVSCAQTRVVSGNNEFLYEVFTSERTIYTYVGGNPVIYVDSKGLFTVMQIVGMVGTTYALVMLGDSATDAYVNMTQRPGADDILRTPDTADAAQQGQKEAVADMGKVGGKGVALVDKNPISSAFKAWDKVKKFCEAHF